VSFAQTVALGALAGFTIFLGLPVGRLQTIGTRTRVGLAMFSVGILAFIFVDVLSNAREILGLAVTAYKTGHGSLGHLIWLVTLMAVGFGLGSCDDLVEDEPETADQERV